MTSANPDRDYDREILWPRRGFGAVTSPGPGPWLARGYRNGEIYAGFAIQPGSSGQVDLVHRHQMERRVVVISFNLRTVAKIKELNPSIRTGALFGPRQRAMKSTRQIIAAAIASGADEILLHHRIVTKRLIDAAHEQRLMIAVWTVDDPRWLARARSLQISAIITNHPAKMLA